MCYHGVSRRCLLFVVCRQWILYDSISFDSHGCGGVSQCLCIGGVVAVPVEQAETCNVAKKNQSTLLCWMVVHNLLKCSGMFG